MISPANYNNMSYTSDYGNSSSGAFTASPYEPSVPGISVNGKDTPRDYPPVKGRGGRPVSGNEDSGRECQTCKNRKYQDGSDEMVSYKSAAHIAPQAAGAAVRAHEQEHVSNAYKKAAAGNGKVLNASVSIHMSVCPECGRSYVSGGTTRTQIKYYNEDNPYQQELKAADQIKYGGMNLDYAV